MIGDTYYTMNLVTFTEYPVPVFPVGAKYQLEFMYLEPTVWAVTPVGFGKPLLW
jgi:hypothetical protein